MTAEPVGPTPKARLAALRALASLEAAKGLLVIVAGAGWLAWDHGVQHFANRLVAHLHLDPARHFGPIFTLLSNASTHRRLLAAGAAAYAIGRIVEAAGLWYNRWWAMWVAVGTAVIYIPFEIENLARDPNPVALAALVINTAVVLYLLSDPDLRHRPFTTDDRGSETE